VIRVDTSDFKRLNRDFEKIAKQALPHATRDTLNGLAFQGRGLWQNEMQRRFILRNDWTTRRVLVDKATGTSIAGMRSVLFSDNENLVKQEHGGTSQHSVPTGVATGEGKGAQPRRRLVRKPNAISAIQLTKRPQMGDRKQRNAAAIKMAFSKGQKFVFLELQKRKGLFRLSGGKRRPQLDMLWDTSKKAHRIPPHPTFAPALKRLDAQAPSIMLAAITQQLKYHKVFGY
jgi:hypothetical protein